VAYPIPMRPAGFKHQPWQANRLTHDGILNISSQGYRMAKEPLAIPD